MKPENPYPPERDSYTKPLILVPNERYVTWQEGFDACLSYLNEFCTEHPIKGVEDLEKYNDYKPYYPDRREVCPNCRRERGLE